MTSTVVKCWGTHATEVWLTDIVKKNKDSSFQTHNMTMHGGSDSDGGIAA